ncbi:MULTISPECIES: ANTAR domain-containing protein [unclassified Rhizobium]|jgi:AmiR/NasT family two-component response regulator|uniref:ANTAR domain-containing response regulator n=1 Tax=unclassified Rhizobium TaxID=2613769 RepID=UPI0006473833|nr:MULTISPECIES: ANTAR domain-containing protein [unclassified Rhizobium]MBN8954226.1 ANTAR domain-containing protein [Rhizobium tropici]OJY70883.1 MAG: ANTAR domain-containing protein [Rhizobium sp. 60-20]RKD50760.1 AmiR/NasT family two-component response regulator [Rhizobium sp. WW_1]
MKGTPNFAGWRVTILAEDDSNTERLNRQLIVLGMRATRQWTPISVGELPDLVIVDVDRGWDELIPWSDDKPLRPVVAVLGSEAPGRIAWALRQGAGAIIPKPVLASAVFPALVLAVSIHEERIRTAGHIARLEERLKLRPVVFSAIEKLKAERQIDDECAYAILRNCAMRRRLPVEQIAAFFLVGSETLSEVG